MIYGFIYAEYREEKHFWEVIKTYLKVLILFFGFYGSIGMIIRGICMVIIIGIYMLLLIK